MTGPRIVAGVALITLFTALALMLVGCGKSYTVTGIGYNSPNCSPPTTVQLTIVGQWGVKRQFCVTPEEVRHTSLNGEWTGRVPG